MASNGGLIYGNEEEFIRSVEIFLQDETKRKEMAANGKQYVLDNYHAQSIVQKFSDFLQ